MSLSKWMCDEPGCGRTAVGKGGAVGLRAIGWYWQTGPQLYCPAHRPDKVPCKQRPGLMCSQCAGEHVVRQVQPKLMGDTELHHYLSEILPTLQRMDLELAVRADDGRSLGIMAHHPDQDTPPPLCEHGIPEYGGCKNADCPNCPDNLIPVQPLAPPEYRPRPLQPTSAAYCDACETCFTEETCRNTDSCPILWCACHTDQAPT